MEHDCEALLNSFWMSSEGSSGTHLVAAIYSDWADGYRHIGGLLGKSLPYAVLLQGPKDLLNGQGHTSYKVIATLTDSFEIPSIRVFVNLHDRYWIGRLICGNLQDKQRWCLPASSIQGI